MIILIALLAAAATALLYARLRRQLRDARANAAIQEGQWQYALDRYQFWQRVAHDRAAEIVRLRAELARLPVRAPNGKFAARKP